MAGWLGSAWIGPLHGSDPPIYALPAAQPLAFADGSALARCSGFRPMLWRGWPSPPGLPPTLRLRRLMLPIYSEATLPPTHQ